MKKNEFKLFTGKNGKAAYILYKNKIYNVTGSKFWKNGVHMARHKAAEDLTDFMAMAPHGDEVLENFKEIATIEKDKSDILLERKEKFRELYRKFHPHPIIIHFPMAMFVFSGIMQSLFLLTKNSSFENSAFYSIVFGTITVIPAVISGFFSWWINYDLTVTNIFRNKIIFSSILLLLGVLIVVLRSLNSDLPLRSDSFSVFYNLLVILSVPVVLNVGYWGGKITWPS